MNGWQKGALAKPVPPAGGEVEVVGYGGINVLGGFMHNDGYLMVSSKPEHYLDIPLIRLDYATRLQAENRDLRLQCGGMQITIDDLQSELAACQQQLTKARELFQESRHIIASEVQRLKTMEANFPKGFCADEAVAILGRYDAFLSNQSAPADKGQL